MNIKPTPEELEDIASYKEHNPVVRYLANKDRLKFNIGDILIRKKLSYHGDDDKDVWEVELTNATNALPRRYVYFYEDQFGVGYVKRLKVTNGNLGDKFICLADINANNERFEVDPLYLDSILMGDGTFDIKALQKKEIERKKEVAEFNKKCCFISNSIKEINEFLLKFTPGQVLYVDTYKNYYGTHPEEYEITSVKEKYISRMNQDLKYEHSHFIVDKEICDVVKYVEIKYKHRWGGDELVTSFDFVNEHLYNGKPMGLMDK